MPIPFSILGFSVLLAVFALLPSVDLLPASNSYDAARLLQLVILCIVSGELLINRRWVRRRVGPPGEAMLAALLIFTLVAASINAVAPIYSWREAGLLIGLWVLTHYLAAIFTDILDTDEWLGVVLGIAVTIYAVTVFVGVAAALMGGKPPEAEVVFGGFVNIRHFNQWQLFSFGPLSLLAIRSRKGWIRRWAGLALAADYFLLFASGSRGALFALLLSTIVVWGLRRKCGHTLVVLNLRTAFAGLAVYMVGFVVPAEIFAVPARAILRFTYQDRLSLWYEALSFWLSSPWLGIGGAGFGAATNSGFSHPHNVPLMVLAEWGIGGVGIVALWLRRGVLTFRNQQGETKEVTAATALSLLTVLGYSLVDGVLVTAMGQMSLCFAVAWFSGVNARTVASFSNLGVSVRLLGCLGLAGISIVLALSYDDFCLRIRGRYSEIDTGRYLVSSRFWVEGTRY